ncbi:MAG: hypothetical protein ABW352_10075 [Polyangiales bacterium]
MQQGVGQKVRKVGWLAFAALWAGLLAYALHAQFAYATTAGAAGQTPAVMPSASKLPRDTLLMFVHAECPCTRASLHELADVLHARKLNALLVVAPATAGRWEDSAAASIAKDIPSLRVFHDDGSEAKRFGAETSGYVVLYDAAGALRFAGGITGSRGHVGENVAVADLRTVLATHAPASAAHPVYGCPLESAQ